MDQNIFIFGGSDEGFEHSDQRLSDSLPENHLVINDWNHLGSNLSEYADGSCTAVPQFAQRDDIFSQSVTVSDAGVSGDSALGVPLPDEWTTAPADDHSSADIGAITPGDSMLHHHITDVHRFIHPVANEGGVAHSQDSTGFNDGTYNELPGQAPLEWIDGDSNDRARVYELPMDQPLYSECKAYDCSGSEHPAAGEQPAATDTHSHSHADAHSDVNTHGHADPQSDVATLWHDEQQSDVDVNSAHRNAYVVGSESSDANGQGQRVYVYDDAAAATNEHHQQITALHVHDHDDGDGVGQYNEHAHGVEHAPSSLHDYDDGRHADRDHDEVVELVPAANTVEGDARVRADGGARPLCAVCLKRVVTHILVPCGHASMCLECYTQHRLQAEETAALEAGASQSMHGADAHAAADCAHAAVEVDVRCPVCLQRVDIHGVQSVTDAQSAAFNGQFAAGGTVAAALDSLGHMPADRWCGGIVADNDLTTLAFYDIGCVEGGGLLQFQRGQPTERGGGALPLSNSRSHGAVLPLSNSRTGAGVAAGAGGGAAARVRRASIVSAASSNSAGGIAGSSSNSNRDSGTSSRLTNPAFYVVKPAARAHELPTMLIPHDAPLPSVNALHPTHAPCGQADGGSSAGARSELECENDAAIAALYSNSNSKNDRNNISDCNNDCKDDNGGDSGGGDDTRVADNGSVPSAASTPPAAATFNHQQRGADPEGLSADFESSGPWVPPSLRLALHHRAVHVFGGAVAPLWSTKDSALASVGIGVALYFRLLRAFTLLFLVLTALNLVTYTLYSAGARVPPRDADPLMFAHISLGNVGPVSADNIAVGADAYAAVVAAVALSSTANSSVAPANASTASNATANFTTVYSNSSATSDASSTSSSVSILTSIEVFLDAAFASIRFGGASTSSDSISTGSASASAGGITLVWFTGIQTAYLLAGTDLLCALVVLLFAVVMKARVLAEISFAERQSVSSRDFSILVRGFPPDASLAEVRDHFSALCALDGSGVSAAGVYVPPAERGPSHLQRMWTSQSKKLGTSVRKLVLHGAVTTRSRIPDGDESGSGGGTYAAVASVEAAQAGGVVAVVGAEGASRSHGSGAARSRVAPEPPSRAYELDASNAHDREFAAGEATASVHASAPYDRPPPVDGAFTNTGAGGTGAGGFGRSPHSSTAAPTLPVRSFEHESDVTGVCTSRDSARDDGSNSGRNGDVDAAPFTDRSALSNDSSAGLVHGNTINNSSSSGDHNAGPDYTSPVRDEYDSDPYTDRDDANYDDDGGEDAYLRAHGGEAEHAFDDTGSSAFSATAVGVGVASKLHTLVLNLAGSKRQLRASAQPQRQHSKDADGDSVYENDADEDDDVYPGVSRRSSITDPTGFDGDGGGAKSGSGPNSASARSTAITAMTSKITAAACASDDDQYRARLEAMDTKSLTRAARSAQRALEWRRRSGLVTSADPSTAFSPRLATLLSGPVRDTSHCTDSSYLGSWVAHVFLLHRVSDRLTAFNDARHLNQLLRSARAEVKMYSAGTTLSTGPNSKRRADALDRVDKITFKLAQVQAALKQSPEVAAEGPEGEGADAAVHIAATRRLSVSSNVGVGLGHAQPSGGAFVTFNQEESLERCLRAYSSGGSAASGSALSGVLQPSALRFRNPATPAFSHPDGRVAAALARKLAAQNSSWWRVCFRRACGLTSRDSDAFSNDGKGWALIVERAPDPSEVIHENLEVSTTSRLVRRCGTTFASLLLVAAALLAMVLSREYSAVLSATLPVLSLCEVEIPASYFGSYQALWDVRAAVGAGYGTPLMQPVARAGRRQQSSSSDSTGDGDGESASARGHRATLGSVSGAGVTYTTATAAVAAAAASEIYTGDADAGTAQFAYGRGVHDFDDTNDAASSSPYINSRASSHGPSTRRRSLATVASLNANSNPNRTLAAALAALRSGTLPSLTLTRAVDEVDRSRQDGECGSNRFSIAFRYEFGDVPAGARAAFPTLPLPTWALLNSSATSPPRGDSFYDPTVLNDGYYYGSALSFGWPGTTQRVCNDVSAAADAAGAPTYVNGAPIDATGAAFACPDPRRNPAVGGSGFCPCLSPSSTTTCYTLPCFDSSLQDAGLTCTAFPQNSLVGCYCLAGLQGALRGPSPITAAYAFLVGEADACGAFAGAYLGTQVLVFAAGAAAAIVNVLLGITIPLLTRLERHGSVSDLVRASTLKLAAATSVNTALIALLVGAKLPGGARTPTALSSVGLLSGSYDDFTTGWYSQIGAQICITMLINALLTPTMALVAFAVSAARASCAVRRLGSVKTQYELNSLFVGSPFDLGVRYPAVITFLVVVLCYGSGMPLLYGLAAAAFGLLYVVDRILLLRYTEKPPAYDASIALTVLNMLPWLVVLHLAVSVWTLSGGSILPTQMVSPAMLGGVESYVNSALAVFGAGGGSESGGVGTATRAEALQASYEAWVASSASWDPIGAVPRILQTYTFPLFLVAVLTLAWLLLSVITRVLARVIYGVAWVLTLGFVCCATAGVTLADEAAGVFTANESKLAREKLRVASVRAAELSAAQRQQHVPSSTLNSMTVKALGKFTAAARRASASLGRAPTARRLVMHTKALLSRTVLVVAGRLPPAAQALILEAAAVRWMLANSCIDPLLPPEDAAASTSAAATSCAGLDPGALPLDGKTTARGKGLSPFTAEFNRLHDPATGGTDLSEFDVAQGWRLQELDADTLADVHARDEVMIRVLIAAAAHRRTMEAAAKQAAKADRARRGSIFGRRTSVASSASVPSSVVSTVISPPPTERSVVAVGAGDATSPPFAASALVGSAHSRRPATVVPVTAEVVAAAAGVGVASRTPVAAVANSSSASPSSSAPAVASTANGGGVTVGANVRTRGGISGGCCCSTRGRRSGMDGFGVFQSLWVLRKLHRGRGSTTASSRRLSNDGGGDVRLQGESNGADTSAGSAAPSGPDATISPALLAARRGSVSGGSSVSDASAGGGHSRPRGDSHAWTLGGHEGAAAPPQRCKRTWEVIADRGVVSYDFAENPRYREAATLWRASEQLRNKDDQEGELCGRSESEDEQ